MAFLHDGNLSVENVADEVRIHAVDDHAETRAEERILDLLCLALKCKDALTAEFRGGNAEPLTLPDAAEVIIERIRALDDAKKNTEEDLEHHKNQLRRLMGDYELGYAGDYKVTWKTQAGRTTVDSKALKAKEPSIYAKYAKQGKPTRVLRIS